MSEVLSIAPIDPEVELDRLATRYRAASGPALTLVNMLGSRVEDLVERLPEPVRNGLGSATENALTLAADAAGRSRRWVPDQPDWVDRASATAAGAVGGFWGVPGTLAELPVTTALLMRSIQNAAAAQGFDPASESVRFDCVRVFGASGPLETDDGADLALLSLRLKLNGATMQSLIARVAPRLAQAMGQKLAAQAVPVLGAAAGASTNYVYAGYYRSIADVHFGVRRLAIELDRPVEVLNDDLRARVLRR